MLKPKKNRPKVMKLYLLTRIGSTASYAEYSSAVVMATSSVKARRIHPDGQANRSPSYPTWVPFEEVRATYLGDACVKMAALAPRIPVVCASYRDA